MFTTLMCVACALGCMVNIAMLVIEFASSGNASRLPITLVWIIAYSGWIIAKESQNGNL